MPLAEKVRRQSISVGHGFCTNIFKLRVDGELGALHLLAFGSQFMALQAHKNIQMFGFQTVPLNRREGSQCKHMCLAVR